MLPGANGSRPMPRKIAGSEMITIDPSTLAINTPSVVLDNAIHLYRSDVRCRTVCSTDSYLMLSNIVRRAEKSCIVHSAPMRLRSVTVLAVATTTMVMTTTTADAWNGSVQVVSAAATAVRYQPNAGAVTYSPTLVPVGA